MSAGAFKNIFLSLHFTTKHTRQRLFALVIHVVMCSVTGAWVQADVFGLRPRLVFGGGTLHIMKITELKF